MKKWKATQILTGAIFLSLVLTIIGISTAGEYFDGVSSGTDEVYGGMYITTTSGASVLTLQDVYYPFTWFDTGSLSSDMTVNTTTDTITVLQKGVYKVDFSVSFAGTLSETFELSAFVNDTEDKGMDIQRKMGTGGDVDSASFTGITRFNVNDVLSVRVKCTSGATKSITPTKASLVMQKIHN